MENGKSLCSMCSTALSTVGSGKRHYKNVHLGEKLPSQLPGSAGGPDDSGGEGFAGGVSQPTHSMVRNIIVNLIPVKLIDWTSAF